MPCIGINCDIRKEKVSFLECSQCTKCNQFPLLLKRRFLSESFRDHQPRISVSSLTSCPKQAYLKLTQNYYQDRTSIISVNIGRALHKYIGETLIMPEKFLYWITPEGNKCVGYLDELNIFDRILYDIKTTAYGAGPRANGARTHHQLQLQIYATIIKERYNVDLQGLKLVYIGLGDKDCLELDVPYISQTKFINEKTNFLQKCLDEKTIPKGEPMWPEWECGYCPFREECSDKVKVDLKN